jgi:hypothetical protein
MPTTSNFGWTTPADTDLVKDGAAAIRTLGNGIDTSFLDLKGGTTGQILSKASNTDLDFTWTAGGDITEVQAGTGISVASGTGPIPVVTNTVATAFDAAGDLVYGTGADTFTKLSLGTANQVLAVNSGATAPEWKTVGSSALVLVKRGTFSGVANTGTTFDDVFTSTYVSYLLNFEFVSASTFANDLIFNLRTTGPATRTTNYKSASGSLAFGSTTSTYFGAAGDDFWQLTNNTYGGGYLWFNRTNNQLQGFYYSEVGNDFYDLQLSNGGGGGCIGFQLKSSSSNITGQVSVYGLAQA